MKHTSYVSARLHILLSMLVLILFQAIGPACRDSNVSRVRIKLKDIPAPKQAAPSKAITPPLPVCPGAGVSPLQRSQPGTGHHSVILTWNASAPSIRPKDNAVGYCLYRSKKKKVAKKNPTCSDCELVNSIPVVGTNCVDDLVADGATYYYVATAITRAGQISSSSNEITTVIPHSPQRAGSFSTPAYPLCRSQPPSK